MKADLGPVFTVEQAALAVAGLDSPDGGAEAARKALGELAEKIRAGAAASPDARKRVAGLREQIFGAEKFAAAKELADPEDLHLPGVLKNRRGHCLGLSILLLCLGERLGWPLAAVGAPDHVFVRYDDGKTRANIETLRGGEELSDNEYATEMRIDRPAAGRPAPYLENLSPEEVLAYLLNNRGVLALARGDEAAARASFDAALKLRPGFPEALRNLGALLGKQKAYKDAIAVLEKARGLHASDARTLYDLGQARIGAEDFSGGLSALEEAARLDPASKKIAARLKETEADLREHHFSSWQAIESARLQKSLEGKKRAAGLVGTYFDGVGFEREVLRRVDESPVFNWKNDAPDPKVPANRFSARWEGYLDVPKASTYKFFLTFNDGARLAIDGKTLLESWEDRGYENRYESVEADLCEGPHRFRLEFFDQGGGARILLFLTSKDSEDPLPLSKVLFHGAD